MRIRMVRDCGVCTRSFVYMSNGKTVTKSRLCARCRKQLAMMKREPDKFRGSEFFEQLLRLEDSHEERK